jgi:hypothetical protein
MEKSKKKLTVVVVIVLVAAVACILLAVGLRFLITSGNSWIGIALTGGQGGTPVPTQVVAITPGPLTDAGSFESLSTVPAGLAACENILVPFAEGHTWTYLVTARGKTYPVDMRVSSADSEQAVVEFLPRDLGITTQAFVDCADGSLYNLPWTAAWMLMDDLVNGSVTIGYVSGELAPSHAEFLAADWDLAWTGEYSLNGSGSALFQGNEYALSLDEAPFLLSCRTAGSGQAAFEPVIVQAGSFDHALKVVCEFETQAAMTFNGVAMNGKITGTMTQWFAPYIGMLKMQVDSASIRYLFVDVPVDVSGNVELTAYETIP